MRRVKRWLVAPALRKSLTPPQKAEFEKKAKEDKIRFDREMEVFNKEIKIDGRRVVIRRKPSSSKPGFACHNSALKKRQPMPQEGNPVFSDQEGPGGDNTRTMKT